MHQVVMIDSTDDQFLFLVHHDIDVFPQVTCTHAHAHAQTPLHLDGFSSEIDLIDPKDLLFHDQRFPLVCGKAWFWFLSLPEKKPEAETPQRQVPLIFDLLFWIEGISKPLVDIRFVGSRFQGTVQPEGRAVKVGDSFPSKW